MSSTVQSSATPVNAPTKSSSPSAASGTTSSNARSSYANATKGQQSSPSVIASGGSPAAVGGLALSHHAHSNSVSPVNGRPAAPPSAPNGPAIVSSTNGHPPQSDHVRAPSVTITAQGATGTVPNGLSTPSRPNISFGSIGASPSPSMSHSTPHMHHNSLSQPYSAPNPARSPSPIPPPAVSSGGRPPSSLAGQSAVNFGSLPGADGSDQSLPLRPGIPSGPGAGPQAQHLRRESSQSAHSDNLNRNFVAPNGRGAGGRPPFNNQQFPGGAATHSPNMFRPGLAMTNRTPSNVPPFQHQVRGANSPFQANRSPAMPPHAQPHMPNMQNGGPMSHPFGYPPHMQQNPMYMQGYDYAQYPYPQQQGFMPPQMYQQVPHPSMSPQPPTQFRPQQPYAPGPYQANPQAQSMSRQASQSGDPRPSSSMGHSPGPHGPQASPSPGPAQSSFQRPAKKSSAIRITNPEGEVVDFKKSVGSPSPAPPTKGPAVVSSGGAAPATPTPPRTVTPSAQQHTRTESAQVKTAEERKKEFQESFLKQLKAEEAVEAEKRKAQQQKDEPAKEPEVEEAPKAEEKVEEPEAEEDEDEAEAEPAEKGETEEERKKREEDEEMERMIAEMEEQERLEEEREKAFAAKRKAEKEEAERKAAEKAANEEEEMKRLEREAEEREEAKSKGKTDGDSDAEAANLFSQLKKNTMFGPGASGTPASETSTPGSESPMPPPAQPASATKAATLPAKNKPAALKLETTKAIEPAQPTAGMQALKTARFLEVKNDAINYPEGIKSPNPALNQGIKGRGQRYDNNFLLQFREVFREKPSTDWDKTIKETVGDGTDSARPQSARTPSMGQGGRSMSGRPGAPQTGVMGNFGAGGRTLPPGTSSEQRFQASLGSGPGRPPMAGFPGGFPVGRGTPFPMGGAGMARTPSAQSIQGMNSPRNASHRGNKGSRRGGPNPAQEAEAAKKMPLTAGMSIAPLEVSQTGWKPTNIGQPAAGAAMPSGHLAPDMVQRKVRIALNKMTPEKFDKLSADILLIASQSKDETDGRTLRQVIQLTFEKACDEAHWSSMYAKFCERMLQDMGPEIRDEGVKDKHGQVVVGGALFRKYLLNRCQEEFERGWEVNLPDKPEGQTEEAAMLSDEYYIAAAAKRRGLGLIQFIGELYKLGMLTLRIMHECVVKLLNFEGTPDEAAIESLVKLLRTIGSTMDSDPKGHSMMDTYIDRIQTIMKIDGLPSRMYYMLLDTTDLRRKQWQSKDILKGPKTITEIREEAAAAQAAAELERQRSSRGGPGGRPQAGRGDARTFSGGGMPPPTYQSSSVGMDDLKKLTRNARPTGSSGGGLGPGSLLSNSRSGSRRGGLGPRVGEESGASSRTNTPPVKDAQSAAHVNAYSALAGLDGDHPDDVASPPSQHASPALTKAQPAAAAAGGEADAGK